MTREQALAELERAQSALQAVRVFLTQDTDQPVEAAPEPPLSVPRGLAEPQKFFDVLRRTDVLGPVLTQPEVDGCNAIMGACAGWPASWVAYALATAYHETAHTMQPIKEYGGDAYFRRMYDIEGARPEKARELGNLTPGDGVKYAGRGYVQLTGKANYAKAANVVGLSLVDHPDDAMQPNIAGAILASGMRGGWFTGKSLADYIPAHADKGHFAAARRIINGTDKADLIAGYALVFLAALQAGGWS